MGYHNSLPEAWLRATTMTTTLAYHFPFPWGIAAGVDSISPVWKNKNVVGNYQSQPCIQVASTRPDDPGAITALGSLAGSGESGPGPISVSSQTAGNYWWRFGFAYALSSAPGFGQGDTSIQATWTSTGLEVGTAKLDLFASVTQNAFKEVTGWVPVAWASKVKAALISRSVTGDFTYRICYRTADTSTDAPSAWSTAFDSARTSGEVCTGDVTLSLSATNNWVQFGIQYYMSTSTPGGGVVQVRYAVR